jgi:hypothetical protein
VEEHDERVEEYDESVEENSQSTNTRVWEIESSRVDSSRVREFELDNSVIPTVKSETNKESGNWVAESVIPNK